MGCGHSTRCSVLMRIQMEQSSSCSSPGVGSCGSSCSSLLRFELGFEPLQELADFTGEHEDLQEDASTTTGSQMSLQCVSLWSDDNTPLPCSASIAISDHEITRRAFIEMRIGYQ